MRRVFIIHGYTGTPEKNWFPWLKSELEKLGLHVAVPALPNTDYPRLNEWLPYIRQTIGNPDEDTFLVGHSLGCPTILRYIESLNEGQVVGGALLVSGFAEPLPNLPQLDSFTEEVWNDERITGRVKIISLIHSDNDESVPFLNAEHMRDRFNAGLIKVHNMGHINEKAGITVVPFVLENLRRMMNL